MMHKPTARVALTIGIVLMAGAAAGVGLAAAAVKITINGVDVTGLTDQKFEGCTVVFDSSGNVIVGSSKMKFTKMETQR